MEAPGKNVNELIVYVASEKVVASKVYDFKSGLL